MSHTAGDVGPDPLNAMISRRTWTPPGSSCAGDRNPLLGHGPNRRRDLRRRRRPYGRNHLARRSSPWPAVVPARQLGAHDSLLCDRGVGCEAAGAVALSIDERVHAESPHADDGVSRKPASDEVGEKGAGGPPPGDRTADSPLPRRPDPDERHVPARQPHCVL